ncbi:PIN-like domain-containing protein [Blastomonas fulva]|uniref:PIN-like domain-containing protein n=1 Tax=Blastomonas fulva TaxID=1550728 RepID=UPI003F6F94AD
MLIPVEVESAADFIVRAKETLARPGTHLYVDTSMVMWLTAIGTSSRQAFFEWAATIEGRIHVPTWTLQEYFRHHQGRSLVNDISDKCVAAEKALGDLVSHLRVYADGSLAVDQPEMAFAAELGDIKARLGSAIKAARAWDYDTASAEVIEWMNERALTKTRAFTSFDDVKRRGKARYGHEVPPGFEDGQKALNRYGDLLFWDDVVADAGERGAEVAAILTRDRKKDWFYSRIEADVGDELKRLRGTWDPVPLPHPMLAFEMLSNAKAQLLLIDELYLGAIMWSTDMHRFGRLAAFTFGMTLERLAAETAPPPAIAARASKRINQDTVSMLPAKQIVAAAKAASSAPAVEDVLASLAGEAPAVEEAIAAFTPVSINAMRAIDLASMSRQLYDRTLDAPGSAAVLAQHLLDQVDKVDAIHASAIVGGMLVGAYFDGITPRNRPVGAMLQDVLAWRTDPGLLRTLDALSRDLLRHGSPAIYLPSASASPIAVRVDASTTNITTPVAVGQVYIGAQAVLVDTTIDPALSLRTILGNAEEATVSSLVIAIGRHFGIPLDMLQLADAPPEELRTILISTALDRFDPARLPIRPGDSQPKTATDVSDVALLINAAPAVLEGCKPAGAGGAPVAEGKEIPPGALLAAPAERLDAIEDDDDDENEDDLVDDEEDMI